MEEAKKDIKPINITDIVNKIWPHRKMFYYVLPATLIITYLYMVCIPRYYSCTVSLAPESSGTSFSGSLGSLASSFGLGDLAKMNSSDAIFAEIYPDVIKSKKFVAELMVVDVKTKKGDVHCNYYTYLRYHQKSAWWYVLKSKIKGLFTSSEKTPTTDRKRSPRSILLNSKTMYSLLLKQKSIVPSTKRPT